MILVRFVAGFLGLILISFSVASAEDTPYELASPAINEATITQIGEEQRARIDQHNIRGGVLSGMIYQRGIGNEASLTMQGGNLDGRIIQYGDDNSAQLMIRGDDNSGTIAQFGNDNSAGLRIDGSGKDVTLIQQGDGHSFHRPIRVGGETPGGLPMVIRQY